MISWERTKEKEAQQTTKVEKLQKKQQQHSSQTEL